VKGGGGTGNSGTLELHTVTIREAIRFTVATVRASDSIYVGSSASSSTYSMRNNDDWQKINGNCR
jgi:hypothetical protein